MNNNVNENEIVLEMTEENEEVVLLNNTETSSNVDSTSKTGKEKTCTAVPVKTLGYRSNELFYDFETFKVGTTGEGDGTCASRRMYLLLDIPTLPKNSRIKKAELIFSQLGFTSADCLPFNIGLYRANGDVEIGPYYANDYELIDYARIKYGQYLPDAYTFNITSLVDEAYNGNDAAKKVVLRAMDEYNCCDNTVSLFGRDTFLEQYRPRLVITYEPIYSMTSTYRTHTHEIGRFGQTAIDLHSGHLMLDFTDFAWSGNRMPVTLKRLYSSAFSDRRYTGMISENVYTDAFLGMNIGKGYKLNLMQCMDYLSSDKYVHIGEDGEETLYVQSDEQVEMEDGGCCYLYKEESGEGVYNPVKRELTAGNEVHHFDLMGRLDRIADKENPNNFMEILYNAACQILTVTDGAKREFAFSYNDQDKLSAITAPDGSMITYEYDGDLLSKISYPDKSQVCFTYYADKPASIEVKDANSAKSHTYHYTFSNERLVGISESATTDSGVIEGHATTSYVYSAAAGKTTVTTTEKKEDGEEEDNVITTVYTFDDDGNIVSEYVYSRDTGRVQTEGGGSGIHPHSGENGADVVSNINNLLRDHGFRSMTAWQEKSTIPDKLTTGSMEAPRLSKFGTHILHMKSESDSLGNGVAQTTDTLPAGEYTFSAYVRIVSNTENAPCNAYLRVCDTAGNVLTESERLTEYSGDYIRLIAPFTLTEEQSVSAEILMDGCGEVYADAAQLENNPYANSYNQLENGNFELGRSAWDFRQYSTVIESESFNMRRSLLLYGEVSSPRSIYQDVKVKSRKGTRETFLLSGWAKGFGLPDHEREGVENPTFRIRAEIYYTDGTSADSPFSADFSPCTEEWQLASVEFAKDAYKEIDYVRVYCDYDYNYGEALFDDIQLVRRGIEYDLTASDFVSENAADGTDDAESDNASDSISTAAFMEAKDAYGNALTETTYTDGEFGTVYRAFRYTAPAEVNLVSGEGTDRTYEFSTYAEIVAAQEERAGNDLTAEIDARGNTTHYYVDQATSRNHCVVDRLGNKTGYTYDDMGRTIGVKNLDKNNTVLASVGYAYDAFDNMTEIARGDGMNYALAYNAFHKLESIGVVGWEKPLIQYTYKNESGRLKEMTYANGHTMKAIYNSIGQMVAEKWFESKEDAADATKSPIAHYKYTYDGEGNIVRSIDIVARKEYNYQYEDGHLVRATECAITLGENEAVTAKTRLSSILYSYDKDGKPTKKRIVFSDGQEHTVYYENTDDRTSLRFAVNGRTITSHSKNDSFGRKVFDELQLARGFVSREFRYHVGALPETHKEHAKLKSTPTTLLVSEIVFTGGRTLSYEYDAEERITKVVDSEDGITEYTYDAMGQLLTETVNGRVVNSMEYDNYGNIVRKNGKTYTYGDEDWKDLLTSFDGKPILYDAQGNPTSYLGHTLTWEKGRQLKSFDDITYTYNANGIRTSKTVDGVTHTYTLDGAKILREEWSNNTLIPLYDNEDSVCGIVYNDRPYYFLKNLQGDVIAITDEAGGVIARYTYDAWGELANLSGTGEGISIAVVNPFRYRSYYYDQEIGMYYLQSRYYDASIGRFINLDTPEVVTSINTPKNLFEYCGNKPINEKDPAGNAVITTILKFVAGLFFGFLTQLASDFIVYLYDRFIKSKEHSIISSSLGDYIGASLSCGASMILPISGKHWKLFVAIGNIIPFLTKYLCILFSNGFDFKAIKILAFVIDLASLLINILVSIYLGNKLKNKLDALRKKRVANSKNTALKLQKKEIKISFNKLGIKASFSIILSVAFLQTLLKIFLGDNKI